MPPGICSFTGNDSVITRNRTNDFWFQVFNRCVIVWDREGVLSCIPHLPYPGEALGGVSKKDMFTLSKNFGETMGKHLAWRGYSGQSTTKKIESIRINLKDLAWFQTWPRDPGLLQPWIPGTSPGTTPGIPSKLTIRLTIFCVNFTENCYSRKHRSPCLYSDCRLFGSVCSLNLVVSLYICLRVDHLCKWYMDSWCPPFH